MKVAVVVSTLTLLLISCASNTAPSNITESISIKNQKLSTNFVRKGIKLEWECAWGTGAMGLTDSMCSKAAVKAIEITAYAPSFGNSEVNREDAFKKAQMLAQAKLSRFIQEEIQTSSVVSTISKNVEKASDTLRSTPSVGNVQITDEEAEKSTNTSIRQNTNDTAHTLTENIRSQSQSIQRGVYVVDEKIVDRQTVQVTIRWDKDSSKASEFFQKKFR